MQRLSARRTKLTLLSIALIGVLCPSFTSSSATQDSVAAGPTVRLQYQPSQSFQTESEQQLKRAVVVARKYKSKAGTLFTAYLLLTNVAAADNCDLKKAALTSDSDFALVAIISEKFKEKEGPEGTAIHRILFGQPDQSPSRYLFVASRTDPERLQSIVGDVPYNAREAWHIGWGGGWKVTVIPKGSQAVPLEISQEQGAGWSFMLNHLAAKKEWLGINPNSTTYLVFSRGESGPTVRFNHKEKKISVSGHVPLTMCGKIPEDVPTPFIPVD
jgi:hypothetical protein